MSATVDEPMARRPLRIGSLATATPVVLAPMAGITNPPFRMLCREFGAGLLVSEMVGARGLVAGGARSRKLATPHPSEPVRSVQLYGVDPATVAAATRILVDDLGVDHVDLNFGCPVPKVTRKGGGAALCSRPALLGALITAAVSAAGDVPVTVKMRMGIDDEHLAYLTNAAIAVDAGAAAVALHARTAADLYGPPARWEAIAELSAAVDAVPVLGNGDVWDAHDAVAMVEQTGCDGVVVGRGCLGRPWLFRDLDDAFAGRPLQPLPTLGEVAAVMVRHAALLVEWAGVEHGVIDFRKHVRFYTQAFPLGGDLRRRLGMVSTLDELGALIDELLDQLDPDTPMPPEARRMKRGHTRGPQRVVVPEGWFDLADDPTPPVGAELVVSGG